MIGLLGGLGAALSWAAVTLTAARASRGIGVTATLAWVMVVGLVVIAPTLVFVSPSALSGQAISLLALAGAANVAGLALEYLALRVGTVGVVAPLCSTEGAIAAVLAVIFGQVPSAPVLTTLGVILVGVLLSSSGGTNVGPPYNEPSALDGAGSPAAVSAVGLSIGAALRFGVNLYALSRAADQASVVWTLWPARAIGTLAVALPMAARRAVPLPGRLWPYVVGSGIAEVTGILAYSVGARHGVAVPAVVGSQFAGLAALGGYLLFGERIGRTQIAGLVTIGVGVAALAALTA